MRTPALSLALVLLLGCSGRDDNDAPKYGASGLPANCRAYVQAAIDGYRTRQYSAEEAMAGLERNCGLFGLSWKSNRN